VDDLVVVGLEGLDEGSIERALNPTTTAATHLE